ncbi:hypothetical protein DFH06DRAFT_1120630 [Mycena polygramma]|nr:hypothetical protein DFH06DRAFT_1120630 [Mycena polygramma]
MAHQWRLTQTTSSTNPRLDSFCFPSSSIAQRDLHSVISVTRSPLTGNPETCLTDSVFGVGRKNIAVKARERDRMADLQDTPTRKQRAFRSLPPIRYSKIPGVPHSEWRTDNLDAWLLERRIPDVFSCGCPPRRHAQCYSLAASFHVSRSAAPLARGSSTWSQELTEHSLLDAMDLLDDDALADRYRLIEEHSCTGIRTLQYLIDAEPCWHHPYLPPTLLKICGLERARGFHPRVKERLG